MGGINTNNQTKEDDMAQGSIAIEGIKKRKTGTKFLVSGTSSVPVDMFTLDIEVREKINDMVGFFTIVACSTRSDDIKTLYARCASAKEAEQFANFLRAELFVKFLQNDKPVFFMEECFFQFKQYCKGGKDEK